jgi:hypothetical protein
MTRRVTPAFAGTGLPLALVVGLAYPAISAQQRAPSVCKIDVRAVDLKLDGADRYASEEYLVDETCKVTRRAREHGPNPQASQSSRRVPSQSPPAADATLTAGLSRQGQAAVASTAGSHACTLEISEDDIAAIAMVTLRNSTSWDTSGSTIAGARVHKTAFPNLDWWFVRGKPSARIQFVREPYTAESTSSGSFYCEGAGPLARYVCAGPSFPVTLFARVLFDGGGTCSGDGRAVGSIVPGGHVRFQLSRDS